MLFPFEVDFYRRSGVGVAHVGHPLVDEVPALPQVWDRRPGPPYTVSLLPGSRRSEVAALLPTLLAAARLLAAELPVHLQLIQAPTIPREALEEEIALSGLPVRIVAEERFRAIADSHLALCASGTATLEVGLLGTPMIVVYRLAFWTYLLGRLLVRLENVALVNLVLGRRVVPELIQREANPRRIAREAARLLGDREGRSEVARMRQGSTVYLCVVDRDRNACSLVNSIAFAFGSAVVSAKTGVLLQNRGGGFRIEPGHPNCIQPGKRPLHTLLAGLATKGGRVEMPFGVMGGQFQPPGQVHFLTNVLDYGMDVQQALDLPRGFHYGGKYQLEAGIADGVMAGLEQLGHAVARSKEPHGGGQAIRIDWERGALIGGSDPRKDGCALGY